MKLVKKYIFLLLLIVFSIEVKSQELEINESVIHKNSYLLYHYGVETLFITKKRGDVLRIPYGGAKVEENFFKTHSVNIHHEITQKYQIGLAFKYGNNFYRSSSRRKHQLNNGDRDYSSYFAAGLTGVINIHKFGDASKHKPFRLDNTVSLQYVRYSGIEIGGGSGSRKIEDISLHAIFLESAALIVYSFQNRVDGSPFSLFYQPISFQFSTNGFGVQYHGMGLKLKL